MIKASYAVCGSFICLLICILFFSKENIKNNETKIYSQLIIVSLIQNLFDFVGLMVLEGIKNAIFAEVLIKIDYILIICWAIYFTIYMIYITELKEKTKHLIKKLVYLTSIISIVLVSVLDVVVINTVDVNDSAGPANNALMVTCIICVVTIIIVHIINLIKYQKKLISKKMAPLYSLILLILVAFLIRKFYSQIVFQPFMFALVTLIMYFTIENPDLKLLRQMELAKDQAEKANNAKSDFLSSMSHEIRTPLNAIVGLSEDNLSYKDKLPSEVIENSEDIMSASQTLLEIVGNILDINKIEANKMEIVETTYNFKEEIESLAKLSSTRIGEKPIDFKINIADDVPYELIGDKTHMKEIVNNLLTNAIKYTDEGTIELSVRCINKNNICNLMISVRDTGKGIKAEQINKLFTKFERLDAERNSTTEGTGLGLAITKALVEMMGGKINVQSRFGQGSIFMVQISQKISKISAPVPTINQSDNAIKTQTNTENNTINISGKKVLIVDDNKLNIKVARRALNDFNFEIDECYDGQECVDKVINGNEYDLILMDIMMPNMSGETAISKLRQKPGFTIPTIALTADAVSGAKEKYIAEGFVDYISKPFSKEQIKEKLDKIFSVNISTQEIHDQKGHLDNLTERSCKTEIEDKFKDVEVHVFDFEKKDKDLNE